MIATIKELFSNQRFLVIYSAAITVVFLLTVLLGAAENQKQKFNEIDVQRINIVEPDGTLRMVLSNKSSFPGIIIKGKEHPHPDRKTAGVLFFNDEGTENGGLIFGGSKDKNGQETSFGHLSFDAYEQDQYFSIDANQRGDKSSESLRLVDRPSYPIDELVALTDSIKNLPPDQQKSAIAKFSAAHTPPHPRLSLGREDDKSVALRMRDPDGHDRIVVQVTSDGNPVIKFLDANGKVTSQLPATTPQ